MYHSRSQGLRYLLAGVSVALLASVTVVSHADLLTYTYSGPAVTIPDNDPAGVNLDITVPNGVTNLTQFQSVTITTSHTFAGDLIATLTYVPANKTIDLFRRIGKSSPINDNGESADLTGTYTFSNVLPVSNAAQPRLEDAGFPATVTVVPSGTYRPTTNTFNGNPGPTFTGETITSLNTTFDGLASASGIWRLNISDNEALDIGTISGFSFTINATSPVPAPSSVAVMAMGGLMPLVAFARRRAAK